MTTPEQDTTTSGTWHDQAPEVVAAVCAQMLLASNDPKRPQVERSAVVAMRAIDLRLELRPLTGRMFYALSSTWAVTTYASGEAPADVLEAARQLTGELAQRPLFGISGSWSPNGEALRVSRDHLAGVEPLLLPHIEGWGIA